MPHERRVVGVGERGEREQHRVIADRARDLRLVHGLPRVADDAGDEHERPRRRAVGLARQRVGAVSAASSSTGR